jgi:hypothetical protein
MLRTWAVYTPADTFFELGSGRLRIAFNVQGTDASAFTFALQRIACISLIASIPDSKLLDAGLALLRLVETDIAQEIVAVFDATRHMTTGSWAKSTTMLRAPEIDTDFVSDAKPASRVEAAKAGWLVRAKRRAAAVRGAMALAGDEGETPTPLAEDDE